MAKVIALPIRLFGTSRGSPSLCDDFIDLAHNSLSAPFVTDSARILASQAGSTAVAVVDTRLDWRLLDLLMGLQLLRGWQSTASH